MTPDYVKGKWQAVFEGGRWKVKSSESKVIASVEKKQPR